MLGDLIGAARLRTLPLASACVLTGGALAAAAGVDAARFQPLFWGCLITVLLLQVLANFANDLGDFVNGADTAEGLERGDRAVASGRISAATMKRVVAATALLAFAAGVATVWLAVGDALFELLLWIGVGAVAIAAAYTYTAGNRPYGYSGLGDISVFAFFGVAGVAGTAALITGGFDARWLLPSLTIGLLSVAVLNLNNLRDHLSDAQTGKRTLIVRMGFERGKIYHTFLSGGRLDGPARFLGPRRRRPLARSTVVWALRAGARPAPRPGLSDRRSRRIGRRTQESGLEHLCHGLVSLPEPPLMTGLEITIVERMLHFKHPAGTSRGVLTEKPSFFVVARDLEEDGRIGIGECSLIPGLSPESAARARMELKKLAASGTLDPKAMSLQYPAVKFAAETALIDLLNEGERTLFPSGFTEGQAIPINGLIWMGSPEFMIEQACALIERGFTTLKMKVGALDFEKECACLEAIRSVAPAENITLRLDANGGLDDADPAVTLQKLERLAAL